jgi:hypothetical protein
MKGLRRIAPIFTPAVLDGLTVAMIFITVFAVILIPHLVNARMADQAQAENLAKKAAR